ncbi:MarR family transcriptional regulator [Clostridium sp. CM028]|uniref:MarR family transcriptional regulator n=1 Tax=unclassified Clostridium TaxID=2614128 RepID=UPI001C0E47EF|nr:MULTISPECIES: MarR family transcriptional regulator [unclassified Clostridium]MBU3093890.1 MarR family transcriptional regulator [Clostridium sp. CF011]MBW9147193.1 MarR family transcriptional regulator [Clostridium sp. CM027]MBW9150354.1 MarR family transcriptional regulator [Clostridium sp. CM028]UVE39731.1 MarR family transcriptional regulator [Clostridium sp. CM027]WAG68638.1 MarR family transcriptional regulator [Clostridium sp. CF011]
MEQNEHLFNIHSLYNLARYAFLKIESNYARMVETSGITLPQLRILWIIKVFPGISLSSVARIGCWTSPTVSNMIKILMSKNLIFKEEANNKKAYKFQLTEKGNWFIYINKQDKKKKIYLFDLIGLFSHKELDFIIEIFTGIIIKEDKEFIFDYIEKLNEMNLKIDLTDFDTNEVSIIKKTISVYNLLRTFILTIKSNHSEPLKEFNVTYAQLRALWIIAAFPGITSSELSEISFWSPSTVHVIVKNLNSKHFIHKEKALIKNAYYLDISQQGEVLIIEDYNKNQKTLLIFEELKEISSQEILKLNSLLVRMNVRLGNYKTEEYIKKTFAFIESSALGE